MIILDCPFQKLSSPLRTFIYESTSNYSIQHTCLHSEEASGHTVRACTNSSPSSHSTHIGTKWDEVPEGHVSGCGGHLEALSSANSGDVDQVVGDDSILIGDIRVGPCDKSLFRRYDGHVDVLNRCSGNWRKLLQLSISMNYRNSESCVEIHNSLVWL